MTVLRLDNFTMQLVKFDDQAWFDLWRCESLASALAERA